MSEVWEHADSEGGELLVLLALADFADDSGWCFPSVPVVAAKARLSPRQARTHIRRLEAKGLVFCPSTKGGAGHSNRYRITPKSRKPASEFDDEKAEAHFRDEKAERRKSSVKKAEVERQKGGSPLPPNRHEPSGTVKEEGSYEPLSSGDDARPLAIAPSKPDPIPEALSAYNAAASESGWPQVRLLTPARRSALAARLREAGGLAGWAAALAKAQASPWCCGQNKNGWRANFDFLTRQSSFVKLMEGNYDDRPHTGRISESPSARRIQRVVARIEAGNGWMAGDPD